MNSTIRILLALVLTATFWSGCATGGSRKMEADKLSAIKTGVTTKAELLEWFGAPMAQSFDTNGKLVMNWHHVRAQNYVFYADMKTQMLSVILDANSVVEKFTVSDGVNKPQ